MRACLLVLAAVVLLAAAFPASATLPGKNGRLVVTGYDRQLWIVDASGAVRTRITNDKTEHLSPRWSPDGTRIVFASMPAGSLGYDAQIHVINADDRHQPQPWDRGEQPRLVTGREADRVPGRALRGRHLLREGGP